MKVFYMSADQGDGSTSVVFFKNGDLAQSLSFEVEPFLNSEVDSFEIPDGPNTIRFQDYYYDANNW